MAVSPGIRNPELNTAECVTQGHEPNIDDPGVSRYIKPILWCSFFSGLLLGPIIAFLVLGVLGNENGEGPLIKSATSLFVFFLLMDFCVILYLIIDFHSNIPREIYIAVVCIILEGIALYPIQYCCSKCCICNEPKKFFRHFCISITCINLLSYHFCWLIVGIMINPAWGLTVLFIVSFVVVASLFSLGQICDPEYDTSPIYRSLMFSAALFGLCLLGTLAVLAGQSFYGRETATDVIKTVLLYVVGVMFWIFKKEGSNSNGIKSNDSPSSRLLPA